jgi:hypothetical protein
LRIAALLIAAFIIVYAAEPFDSARTLVFRLGAPESPGIHATESSGVLDATGVTVRATHCSAAVLDAWRAPKGRAGWFGYAPLTTASIALPGACRNESRHRLRMAGFGIVVVVGLLAAAWLIDRRRDTGIDPSPGLVV